MIPQLTEAQNTQREVLARYEAEMVNQQARQDQAAAEKAEIEHQVSNELSIQEDLKKRAQELEKAVALLRADLKNAKEEKEKQRFIVEDF